MVSEGPKCLKARYFIECAFCSCFLIFLEAVMGGVGEEIFRKVLGKTRTFVKRHVYCSRSVPVLFGCFVVLFYVCVI